MLLLAGALSLDESHRARLSLWLAIGTVIGVALLAFEIASGLGFLRLVRGTLGDRPPLDVYLNRAATVLALLEWPTAVVIGRCWGKWPAVLFLAAALGVLVALASASALFASALGLLAGGLAYAWPRRVPSGIGWVGAAGILLAPLAGLPFLAIDTLSPWIKGSGVHRLVIWNFVAKRIVEHPLAGWGLDTARLVPGGQDRIPVQTRLGLMNAELLPLHPHNGALQWWLELGLPGALMGAALVLLVARSIPIAWGRLEAAALTALLAAALTITMLSYGVWQFWWLAALWLAAAFAAACIRPPGAPAGGA
jgi:O-antigen ligase